MSNESNSYERRDFLKTAGLATFSAAALSSFALKPKAAVAAETASHGIKKAVKIGMVGEGKTLVEKFKLVKSLGYDGIELNSPGKLQSKRCWRRRKKAA